MKARGKGFTIVELLIVIVVIGILAAVSIVSYTGITQNASNTATIQAVSDWAKLLQNYATVKGDYPYAGITTLTPPYPSDDDTIRHGYPCLGAYPASLCGSISGVGVSGIGTGRAFVDPDFDALVKAAFPGKLPQPSPDDIMIGGQIHRGAFINLMSYSTGNAGISGPGIGFFLKGATCPGSINGAAVTTATGPAGSSGVKCNLLLPSFRSI